jgi:hypothetical protein
LVVLLGRMLVMQRDLSPCDPGAPHLPEHNRQNRADGTARKADQEFVRPSPIKLPRGPDEASLGRPASAPHTRTINARAAV